MKSAKKTFRNSNRIIKPRKWFYAIPFLIPVVFFIALEILLRMTCYGRDYTLFKQISSYYPGKLFINPDIARKYFSNLNNIPAPVNDAFDKIKKKNAFRIFVLGESSAEGFPYAPNGSFPRDLKRRLELLYPDNTIEVVNCGMSAISSYTVRDFVPDIIEQKPDLIIIYMGHNEYYGALGVASSVSGIRSRVLTNIYLKLEDLRTFQLIENSLSRLISIFRSSGKQPNETLMQRMIGNSLIPFGSELYNAGIEQFKGNTSDILDMFKKAGIPVIIGSLTCNLKDLKPFISRKEKGYPTADECYKEAETDYNSGRFKESAKLFVQAKELDELRFRAPEIFNRILRELSTKYDYPFIDIDSVFKSSSPHGIVGSDLIIDHLHPNLKGYKLMAKAYFEEMSRTGFLPSGPMNPIKGTEQDSILDARFPFTALDSTAAVLTIDVITGAYPFVPKGTPNLKLQAFKPLNFNDSLAYKFISRSISLENAHAEAAERYYELGDISGFCDEMNDLIADKPFNPDSYHYAALKLINLKRFNEALPFLEELNRIKQSAFSTKWLGQIYLEQKEYDEALKYLGESLQYSDSDFQVWYNIAGAYYYKNRPDESLKAIKKSLELNPKNAAALNFYKILTRSVKD